MQTRNVSPQTLSVYRALAGSWADEYLTGFLAPSLAQSLQTSSGDLQELSQRLIQPYQGLQAVLGTYAFFRRGKDRHELSSIALEALRRTADESAIEKFLAEGDAEQMWNAFAEVCQERGRKPMEQLNRGILEGMAELSQEIYSLDGCGSIVNWIVSTGRSTRRIEPNFIRMVEVRGIGPKLVSLLMRDLAYLFELEERLDPIDRLYLQPIDKWIRAAAPTLIEEPSIDQAADWVLAGKLSKFSRKAGVSGARLNMGLSHFGALRAKTPDQMGIRLRELTTSSPDVSLQ